MSLSDLLLESELQGLRISGHDLCEISGTGPLVYSCLHEDSASLFKGTFDASEKGSRIGLGKAHFRDWLPIEIGPLE